mmetsp:Transcript_19220/g.24746  ORF Transcript_19220/g.24746 Transcript_19220/m.24746 type:complete len:310 (+) Transcript_19220:162-1091(+)
MNTLIRRTRAPIVTTTTAGWVETLRVYTSTLSLQQQRSPSAVDASPMSTSTTISTTSTTAKTTRSSVRSSIRCFGTTTSTTKDDSDDDDAFKQERQEILFEAAYLTRSLYRVCLKSTRFILKGNEHDEQEFQKIEKRRMQSSSSNNDSAAGAAGGGMNRDPRLSMLSMVPPVNRPAELQARTEYYHQFTQENFIGELDCLLTDDQGHYDRYFSFLKQGEVRRKWLLKDMKFQDPYSDIFDSKRIGQLEKRVKNYLLRKDGSLQHNNNNSMYDSDDDSEDDDADDSDNDLSNHHDFSDSDSDDDDDESKW